MNSVWSQNIAMGSDMLQFLIHKATCAAQMVEIKSKPVIISDTLL